MYKAYFVNEITGKIITTSQPSDNPICNKITGWREINESMYLLFKLVILANGNVE